VQTALSLVGFKSELQPAMEYVFGSSFVCKDMDAAKQVTFDERINKKSVTLDGDSFDPSGTLTGGREDGFHFGSLCSLSAESVGHCLPLT